MNELAQALQRAGVRYCVLHGWESLPDRLPSDLDIAVAPEDLGRAEQILRRQSGQQVVQLLRHEATGFYFVLASETPEGSPRFVQVDVATDYRRNGLVFLTAGDLLRERRRWGDFWVAGPRTELRYLLIKKVDKGAVPPHQRLRLQALVDELRGEERVFLRDLFGSDLGDRAAGWIRRGDWERFDASLPALRRTLRWNAVRRAPLRALRAGLAEIRRRLLRARSPTGLLIAVLGPDGSGKTTLISHLERDLRGAFRRTRRFHFRPGLLASTRTSGPVTDPHAQPPRSWFASVAKIVHYASDFWLGYVWLIRPLLVRSTLVLFDRYWLDLLVDPRRYRFRGPPKLARVVARAVPSPDLIVVLDVPAEQIARRKVEVSNQEARRQRDAYRRLAFDFPNVIVLDGSRNEREVANDAARVVVHQLQQRYERRPLLAVGPSPQWDPGAWLGELLRLEATEPR